MATESNPKEKRVQVIPDGYYTVTPFVNVKGAIKFAEFLKKAFNAQEPFPPVLNEDGTVGHGEVRIGNSIVMMFDSKPDWPQTPSFLRLYVEDCDATCQQAVDAGATLVTRPTNMAWGDRVARVRDPFGNLWWIQTRMEELDLKEIEKRMGQQEYIDAMKYVESAEFFSEIQVAAT